MLPFLILKDNRSCFVFNIQIQEPIDALIRAELFKFSPSFAAVASEFISGNFSSFLVLKMVAKLFPLIPVPFVNLTLRKIAESAEFGNGGLIPVSSLPEFLEEVFYLVLAFANSVFLLLLASFLFLCHLLSLFLVKIFLSNYLCSLHLHTVRNRLILVSHCLLGVLQSPLYLHLI